MVTTRPASQSASLRSNSARKPATLLVLGQSTEQGPVYLSDKATYPNAFTSARNPGFAQKRLVPVANRGSYWAKVYDDMWDWGYDLDILNGAVGGASLLTHICGTLQLWVANSAYYQQRKTSLNYPDMGDYGDVIQITNGVTRHFVPSAARKRQAFNAAPFLGVVGTSTYQDFVGFSQTGELSGGSLPDVSTVAVGATITDGTNTLLRVDSGFLQNESVFYPGIDPAVNSGQPNYNLFGTFGERSAGYGWDPLGIIAAAERLAAGAVPSELKLVWFSQGQADLGAAATTYQRAVMLLSNFFLRRGWTVILGNTVYSPASAGSTSANYQLQVDGVDAAVTALQAAYPGQVQRGANLFSALGTTGAMGGQKATAAAIASNVLTVSTVQAGSGSGFAVGQRIFNGAATASSPSLGTIVSLGTGTGGTGTYNLSGGVDTASTAMVGVGSGLQFDGVHFNGSMVASAGAAVATSLKAFLPQRALS